MTYVHLAIIFIEAQLFLISKFQWHDIALYAVRIYCQYSDRCAKLGAVVGADSAGVEEKPVLAQLVEGEVRMTEDDGIHRDAVEAVEGLVNETAQVVTEGDKDRFLLDISSQPTMAVGHANAEVANFDEAVGGKFPVAGEKVIAVAFDS